MPSQATYHIRRHLWGWCPALDPDGLPHGGYALVTGCRLCTTEAILAKLSDRRETWTPDERAAGKATYDVLFPSDGED